MPHINVKCYPKNLSERELKALSDDLTALISARLSAPEEYVTIAYTEIAEDKWKEAVYDAEIKPNAQTLLRKPHYTM